MAAGSGIGQRTAQRTQARSGQGGSMAVINLEWDELVKGTVQTLWLLLLLEGRSQETGHCSSPGAGLLSLQGGAVLLLAFITIYCDYMHWPHCEEGARIYMKLWKEPSPGVRSSPSSVEWSCDPSSSEPAFLRLSFLTGVLLRCPCRREAQEVGNICINIVIDFGVQQK